MKTLLVLLVTIVLSSVCAYAGINDGLVAYYPFNGNVNDESGNGNNGIVYGATLTNDRLGNPNSAYSFDGINDYISVPDSYSLRSPTEAVSISAWIYLKGWYNFCNRSGGGIPRMHQAKEFFHSGLDLAGHPQSDLV